MCGANPHPLYYKEEEMTIMCQVMLNSIDKVKEFVNKTSRVDGDVFLQTESSLSDLEEVMHMEQITRHLTLM